MWNAMNLMPFVTRQVCISTSSGSRKIFRNKWVSIKAEMRHVVDLFC